MTGVKIVVFSDSHGNTELMVQTIQKEKPDLVLHLGDVCRDIEAVSQQFYTLAVQNVCGNCDGFTETPDQRILQVEGRRILMTHGHRYHVKSGYGAARYAALEAQADILLFGHTHVPFCQQVEGLWMMNPGSCQGWGASYGVILLEKETLVCYTTTIQK